MKSLFVGKLSSLPACGFSPLSGLKWILFEGKNHCPTGSRAVVGGSLPACGFPPLSGFMKDAFERIKTTVRREAERWYKNKQNEANLHSN